MSREERVQLVLTRPEEVDRFTCEAMRDSIGVHWGVTHGMFAFGAKSPGELLSKQISWTLEGVAEGIMCPTLVIDVENEQFFGSQAQKLHGALKCPKSLTIFRSSEGADLHCQAGALLLSNQRIFGWVDETLKSMG